jgi:hypothetical protein
LKEKQHKISKGTVKKYAREEPVNDNCHDFFGLEEKKIMELLT